MKCFSCGEDALTIVEGFAVCSNRLADWAALEYGVYEFDIRVCSTLKRQEGHNDYR